MSGSGISWAICKSAPRSRHTTTPVPHHSVFYRPDALPAVQPTASKHWRQPVASCTSNTQQSLRTPRRLAVAKISKSGVWNKFQREVTLFLEVSKISLQQSCGIGGKSLCQNQLDLSSHFDTYRHLWWTNGWIDRRTHDSSIYHTSIESCSKKVHVIISQIILSKIKQF